MSETTQQGSKIYQAIAFTFVGEKTAATVLNEILARFKTRPEKFITDENGIAVKQHKANWVPKGWSLTPAEIEAIDEQFAIAIRQAKARRSKSLLPLQRDRVMYHLAIHFALRVSELVTVQMTDFRASHDPRLACFGDFGVLTVKTAGDLARNRTMSGCGEEPAVTAPRPRL